MYLLSQSFSIKANKRKPIQDTNYRQTNITLQNVQSLGQMKKTPQLILFKYYSYYSIIQLLDFHFTKVRAVNSFNYFKESVRRKLNPLETNVVIIEKPGNPFSLQASCFFLMSSFVFNTL